MGNYYYIVKSNVHIPPENVAEFKRIYNEKRWKLGGKWEWDEADDGSITNLHHTRSQSTDQVFLEAIAPYVEDEGYVEMRDEDDDRWRYVFRNGEVKRVEAVITFPEE